MLSKAERLRLIFERLLAAPPASSIGEAKTLLAAVMREVEDTHSGVVCDPQLSGDGRMYPPLDDRYLKERTPNREVFNNLAHATSFGSNGAIRIEVKRTREVVCDKMGTDGKPVPTGGANGLAH